MTLSGPNASIITGYEIDPIPIIDIAPGVCHVLREFHATGGRGKWEFHMGDVHPWRNQSRPTNIEIRTLTTAEDVRDAAELKSFRRIISYKEEAGLFSFDDKGITKFWNTLELSTMIYQSQPLLDLMEDFRHH